MFEKSYKKLILAEQAENEYVKLSEQDLFIKIDIAIKGNCPPQQIKALISSLPSSDSREKYIEFIRTNRNTKIDPRYVIDKWIGKEFQELYSASALALNKHVDEVMKKVNSLLLNGKIEEVNSISKLECVNPLVVIYIADALRMYNKNNSVIS